MPCWTIQTTQIHLDKLNHAGAVEALKTLGYRVTVHSATHATAYDPATGNSAELKGDALTVFDQTLDRAAIKREYSRTMVERQAKRLGWRTKRTPQGHVKLLKK